MGIVLTDPNNPNAIKVLRAYKDLGINASFLTDNGKLFDEGFAGKDQEKLLEIISRIPKGDVFIPIAINSVFFVSKNIDKIAGRLRVMVPPHDSLSLVNDKYKLMEFAKKLDIPVPKTYSIRNYDELLMFSKEIKYPVVIKLREEIGTVPSIRYRICHTRKELLSSYKDLGGFQKNPMIQELVKGAGYGASFLFDEDSNPVAFFCHKRLREFPITGGPSTFCEGVHEPEIVRFGLKLLKKLKWKGVAMVEFKRDGSGEFRLLEINPRFWGSMPLAIVSGVNFPLLLYRLLLGETVKCRDYKAGMKLRFFFNDMLSIVQYMFKGNRKISYLYGFVKSLLDFRVKEGDRFSMRKVKNLMIMMVKLAIRKGDVYF
jgi:predicted ATP-grasp superfamily ATP-dependent carboligase